MKTKRQKKTIENWADLCEPAKTILENVDLHRRQLKLVIGLELEIEHYKGIITDTVVDDIRKYERSKENEGFYKTTKDGDVMIIHFLKGNFD
ncbi:hypothetical protein U8V72_15425 [Priestia filamentosa]|uniref:hypothetical protein n=1 Tax=Priestia filamentosa TaxID=1402861 RepID=UPI0005895D94